MVKRLDDLQKEVWTLDRDSTLVTEIIDRQTDMQEQNSCRSNLCFFNITETRKQLYGLWWANSGFTKTYLARKRLMQKEHWARPPYRKQTSYRSKPPPSDRKMFTLVWPDGYSDGRKTDYVSMVSGVRRCNKTSSRNHQSLENRSRGHTSKQDDTGEMGSSHKGSSPHISCDSLTKDEVSHGENVHVQGMKKAILHILTLQEVV